MADPPPINAKGQAISATEGSLRSITIVDEVPMIARVGQPVVRAADAVRTGTLGEAHAMR